MPRKKPAAPRVPASPELPAERQARRLRAQLEVMQLKAAKQRMAELTGDMGGRIAALGVHAAADIGRRNADWRYNNASADLANIPDSAVLIGRARQLDRDSWIVRSAKKSFVRNVVGRGIQVMPHARDPHGKPLTKLNSVAHDEFVRWSHHCDIERRKSFNQMQQLAAGEKFVVGEHLWMWVYRQPGVTGVKVDTSEPVGLRLQAFEPEQFDLRILSFEGREVRGGVEVDENGAPLAYHLYTRNPNDVLYRHAFFSERVPRSRMLHYMRQSRVLQTRADLPLAPVMSDIRDLERYQSASLWRSVMEANIGLIITQPMPGGGQGPASPFPNNGQGPPTSTPSGMNTFDMTPGMVARLVNGEEITPFVPQSPGNQYAPFTQQTVRGIGAGLGMSFGQIMRQNDANYSAARQDMLEDRREQEPEQELIVDCLIRPTYELWFQWAAMEGRFDAVDGFDMDEYLSCRHRYHAADFIPPAQTWIDPEKEANAFAMLLKNRLITREEIVAMRGGRFYAMIEKLEAETIETAERGLTLPENAEEWASVREMVKAMLSNRLGTIDNVTANSLKIPQMLKQAGLPTTDGYTQPLLPVVSPPGNLATGDPVKNAEGDVIGGGIAQPVQPSPGAAPAAAAPNAPSPVSIPAPSPRAGLGWVTINGEHVFINESGEITKGPSHLIGHKPHDIPEHQTTPSAPEKKPAHASPARPHDKKPSEKGGTPAEEEKKQHMLAKSAPAASKEYFHGTAASNVDSILKNGVKPTDKTLGFPAAYATSSKDAAFSYGYGGAVNDKEKQVAVVVVKNGRESGMHLPPGENNTAFKPSGIGPEDIDRIEIYDLKAGKNDKPVKVVYGKGHSPSGHKAAASSSALAADVHRAYSAPDPGRQQHNVLGEPGGGGEFPPPEPPPANVPRYRIAEISAQSCASCSWAAGERCSRFNFVFDPVKVCDDWAARSITENIGAPNTAKTFPPGPQPGEDVLENRFFPDADNTPRPL